MTYFRRDAQAPVSARSRTAATGAVGRFARAVPRPRADPGAGAARGLPARGHRPGARPARRAGRSSPANHISFADEFFTPLAARRQVVYFAKAEYFTTPGPARTGDGRVLPQPRATCRSSAADTRAAASVIDIGVEVLRAGRALGIFPEGTRSPDGRLYKFRTGVARLALRSGAPVVPVGLVGTREVQPPGERRWHRAPVGRALRRAAALRRPRRRGAQRPGAARGHRDRPRGGAGNCPARTTSTATRSASSRTSAELRPVRRS